MVEGGKGVEGEEAGNKCHLCLWIPEFYALTLAQLILGNALKF